MSSGSWEGVWPVAAIQESIQGYLRRLSSSACWACRCFLLISPLSSPSRTRSGDVVRLVELLDEAKSRCIENITSRKVENGEDVSFLVCRGSFPRPGCCR